MKIRRIFSAYILFFSLFFAVTFACTAVCSAENNRTIKVGYPIQSLMTDLDENGNYIGYTYEYLEEIAQYTGWNYEFIEVPGTAGEQVSALMEMLKNGEIDLMGAMLYDESINQEFAYTGHSYGSIETVLQTLIGQKSDTAVDSIVIQNMRIAVSSDTDKQRIHELNEYCDMNLITPELVSCATYEDQIDALKAGRADALLSTSMNASDELRTIASFAPKQLYFILAKNNGHSSLMSELNEAMLDIEAADPYFTGKLYEKYFISADKKIKLSDEELEYIEVAGPIRVGIDISRPPFEYKNKSTGELKGISIELLNYISKKTNLHFIFKEAKNQDELYEMVKDGTVDIIAEMNYDYNTAGENGLAMSRPYISSQYLLIMGDNQSRENIVGKRLALPKNSLYKDEILGKVTWYDSVYDCLIAVKNGSEDYTYINSLTAEYYLSQPGFETLNMIPQSYTPAVSCFGLHKPVNKTLLSIMNKLILTISENELQAIININTIQQRDYNFKYYISKYPIQIITGIIGIFVIILLLLIIILVQRIKRNKEMQIDLQKHLSLYSVSNDYFFEYDFKKNKMVFNNPDLSRQDDSKLIEYIFYDTDHEMSEKKREGRNAFLSIIQSGKDGVIEAQIYCFDEELHWLRITMETIRDNNGMPLYAVGRINIIDDEKNAEESLLDQAQRDSLTHIYNNETSRRLISKSLTELTESDMSALLILDIDNFKNINDTYGHLFGDKMLRAVADLLKSSFRSNDIVARPGGDEFLIYMTRIRDTKSLAEKCASLCSSIHNIKFDDNNHLTISMGAAVARAGMYYDVLYQTADKALYRSKNSGRDKFEIVE